MKVQCMEFNGYNQYTHIREMGYNVISYLMKSNDDLWKLLKYNTTDALSKPELSMKEKSELVWGGTHDIAKYRVFRSPFLDDSIEEQISQLRVYITSLNPDNHVIGTVDICLEVVVHNKIVNLEDGLSRPEVMLQELLKTLNGREINGVGKLFFDRRGSFYNLASMNRYNNRNFFGYSIIMSTKEGYSE